MLFFPLTGAELIIQLAHVLSQFICKYFPLPSTGYCEVRKKLKKIYQFWDSYLFGIVKNWVIQRNFGLPEYLNFNVIFEKLISLLHNKKAGTINYRTSSNGMDIEINNLIN